MSKRPINKDRFSKKPSKQKRAFKCNPICKFGHFRCSQRNLGRKFRNNKGWFVFECRYVEDGWCEGSTCKYAFCNARKMKTDGTCGMTTGKKKPKRNWDEEDEEMEQEEDFSKWQKKTKVKIQDKAFKKFRQYEDY